ncbi:hypothetical protein EPA93_21775 [Ktedonosporobacter rubrisoli]|uniref:HEAT repeat domain-containing protein n=1 Tax=Ktedonosporobacter rubrisoli TaxID=2509675 RepID=A0A4P6JSG2_KTERU|nr:hypothetical protein [Ktedonosporobacter rubrisoli]QBD78478.1 hypothetical protein EPA93_21775 [Ktedonosporobacter rubrisoli]
MEKWDAGPLQSWSASKTSDGNIIELESRKQLHHRLHELIKLSANSSLTRSDLRQSFSTNFATFGPRFIIQLVRMLPCCDHAERQAIVWLLTLIDDETAIEPLRQIVHNEGLSRSIRLSASLALAGMSIDVATNPPARARLYAIS